MTAEADSEPTGGTGTAGEGADRTPLRFLLALRAPVALAVTEAPAHVVRFVSRPFCALVGRGSERLVGRPYADAVPELAADGSASLLDRVYGTGEPARAVDVPRPDPARGTSYLTYTVWPVPASPGRPPGLVLSAVDTTEGVLARRDHERTAMEAQAVDARLLLAEAKLAELVEEASAARRRAAFLTEAGNRLAASLDYETTLASVARLAVPNLADWCFVDLLEADRSFRCVAAAHADPAKASLAQRFRSRYPPDPDAPVGLPRVARTGRSELVPDVHDSLLAALARDAEHYRILRAVGIRSYMCVALVARGRTLGVISFVTAESSRCYGPADLALAEELARRAALSIDNARLFREAQEAIRVREEFLGRASHELRTPLTVVKGHLALLGKRLVSADAEAAGLVGVAGRHVDRMIRLIADILDAFRLQAGRLALEPEPFDLDAVVAEALAQAQPLAQEKGIVVTDHVACRLVLVGDRLKLEQVVVNLLTNAIKHTPAGGTIRIEGGASGAEELELSVRDTGEGIPHEHLERIFEPFYQVGSAAGYRKAPGQGAGLGLALVRGLVELHDGRVWAESEGLGKGSRFVVRLPRGETRRAPA